VFKRLGVTVVATVLLATGVPAGADSGERVTNAAPVFTLTPDESLDAYAAKLQTALGTRRPVADVLDSADRSTTGCTDDQARALPEHYDRTDIPLPANRLLHSSTHFCWDSGDSKVAYWLPQGVTGSSDADDDGRWGDRRVMAVSWHYDTGAAGTSLDKGVRVSFVDMATGKYRHVLLVEPTRTAVPDFKAVPIHAGGLAWLGRYLYVADTNRGVRLFDMERILQVSTGEDLIGKHGDAYYAHNYRYVLPQVAAYRQATVPAAPCAPSAASLCFSSISLDRSTTPDSLVVGEYRDGRSTDPAVDGGRVVRYPVAADTRKLVLDAGKVMPTDAVIVPRSNVQGVQTWQGRYYVGRSSALKHSFLYSLTPNGPVTTWSWAIGGEDLYHEHGAGITAGSVWTATEHVDRRVVFAVPLSDIG